MKRLTALLTVSLMTASMFTGCGDSDNNSESDIASERSSLSDTKPDNSTKDNMSEEETSVVVTEAEPINLEDTVKSELDLYEDILKNPNAHTAIIDPDSRNYNSYTYCIADINDDGKYELVLKSENKEGSYDPYGVLTVVKADGKVYKWEFSNTPEFHANGIVGYSRVSTHFPQCFLDVNSGDMWEAYSDYVNEQMDMERKIYNLVTDERLEGKAATEKEAELSSGAVIKPKWTAYSWYDAEDMEIVVSEKKDIEYSWENAYLEIINTENEYDSLSEYALIYLDKDDIPELYVDCGKFSDMGRLYSFHNGKLITDTDFNDGGYKLEYYVERTGKLCGRIIPIGGLHMIFQEYNDGEFKTIIKSSNLGHEDWDASINDIAVSEEEYTAQINAVNESDRATPLSLKSYQDNLLITFFFMFCWTIRAFIDEFNTGHTGK